MEDCIIKMKNISEIMSIDQYRKAYPKRVYEEFIPTNYLLTPPVNNKDIINRATSENLKNMIIGLKRFINRTVECPNAEELLLTMEKRLKTL